MMASDDEFVPRWASPPGATILQVLDERDLSVGEFAQAVELPEERVGHLLEGRERISLDLARRLTEVLGGSAAFWIARDGQYQDDASRVRADAWVTTLPTADMAALGWISRGRSSWHGRIDDVFEFFGVADLDEWQQKYGASMNCAHYRLSEGQRPNTGAVAAWLRQAEREAADVEVARWDRDAFAASLAEVRTLTTVSDPQRFVPRLQSMCAKVGVVVTVLRAPRGCPASGAARLLEGDRAQIILTARYLSDDHLWFTFFHESGHLLLHDVSEVFVDELDRRHGTGVIPDEREADAFAADQLIPPEVRKDFPAHRPTPLEIRHFAQRAGVSSGIVVGQMQHAGVLPYGSVMNRLKRRYHWVGSTLEKA